MSSPLKLKNTSNSYLRTEAEEEEGFWVEEAIVGQFLDESLERVEEELVLSQYLICRQHLWVSKTFSFFFFLWLWGGWIVSKNRFSQYRPAGDHFPIFWVPMHKHVICQLNVKGVMSGEVGGF